MIDISYPMWDGRNILVMFKAHAGSTLLFSSSNVFANWVSPCCDDECMLRDCYNRNNILCVANWCTVILQTSLVICRMLIASGLFYTCCQAGHGDVRVVVFFVFIKIQCLYIGLIDTLWDSVFSLRAFGSSYSWRAWTYVWFCFQAEVHGSPLLAVQRNMLTYLAWAGGTNSRTSYVVHYCCSTLFWWWSQRRNRPTD